MSPSVFLRFRSSFSMKISFIFRLLRKSQISVYHLQFWGILNAFPFSWKIIKVLCLVALISRDIFKFVANSCPGRICCLARVIKEHEPPRIIRDLCSQHICPTRAGFPIPPSQASERSVLAWSLPVMSGFQPQAAHSTSVSRSVNSVLSLCAGHWVYQREQHGHGPALAYVRMFFF